MGQFDDFNGRVERVKAETDAMIASDAMGRANRQVGELGFGWRVLEFFMSLVGEIFTRAFVWIFGGIVVVGGVSVSLGVSFQTALVVVGVAAVAAHMFALVNR